MGAATHLAPEERLVSEHGGSYAKRAEAASVTQRTLTVVIKFGHDSTVESVSYHSTDHVLSGGRP